ncbi:MAG: hydrogenase maturation protease [Cyanobacteria bacterium P01_A01_bin.116]
MARSTPLQAVLQSRFLIIGYGNELCGDDAVGSRVADTIAGWHLPSVKTISTHQLTPELVNDIVLTDYVIFIDACSGSSCARTVQLDPIVVGNHAAFAAKGAHSHSPFSLMTLTQQLYGRIPQAWLLQVPTESLGYGEELSSTTERGCDRAIRTIEQFLRTYQPSRWMKQSA